jgi:hypothetical protein
MEKIECSRILLNILLCIFCGCVVMIHYIVQLFVRVFVVCHVRIDANKHRKAYVNKWQDMCKESLTVKYIILFT